MTRDELTRRVAEFGARQPWNHNFQLPHDVQTRPGVQLSHGKNEVKWERIRPLVEAIGLRDKRVLDVGCNEGFFSFELEGMGASVVGIDVDEQRIAKAKFVREILGRPGVSFDVVDIYGEAFARQPKFDLCLCMGFLHRIPDPFTAIARLGDRSDVILFEWKALKFGPHQEPFAYFSPKGVDTADYYGTEYWLLSYAAVESILRRLGFSRFHRVDDPTQRRALLVAGKVDNPVFHRPDVMLHRGRLRAVASHTKRYVRTLLGVISGRVNA
jgi:SAM-dependent methyltransferase